MAAFSQSYNYNGKSVDWLSLCDMFTITLSKCRNMDEIYFNIFIENYEGKNIEIKVTDVEKDKWYQEQIKNVKKGD